MRRSGFKAQLCAAAVFVTAAAMSTMAHAAPDAAEARAKPVAPKDMKLAWAFRFPAEAAGALAMLDPREAVAVEFLFEGSGRDQVRRAYVEVGDFAAGRAFLQVAAQ